MRFSLFPTVIPFPADPGFRPAASRRISKMSGAQRFGNLVFAARPFARINQLAAGRAKRAMRSGKPVTLLLHVGQAAFAPRSFIR
jgi:hypothetical protein